MTIYQDSYPKSGWLVFDEQKRYWFARLMLEAMFWNNCQDEMDRPSLFDGEKRELCVPGIGHLSVEMRDAAWWRLLHGVCYPEPTVTGALTESSLYAVSFIIKDLLEQEIELAGDELSIDQEIEDWQLRSGSEYRSLVLQFYRDNYNQEQREEAFYYFFNTAEEMLTILLQIDAATIPDEKLGGFLKEIQQICPDNLRQLAINDCYGELCNDYGDVLMQSEFYRSYHEILVSDKEFSNRELYEMVGDRLWEWLGDKISDRFDMGGEDFLMDPLFNREEQEDLKIDPTYFAINPAIKEIQPYRFKTCWDLLFACLDRAELPKEAVFGDMFNDDFEDDINELPQERKQQIQDLVLTHSFVLPNCQNRSRLGDG